MAQIIDNFLHNDDFNNIKDFMMNHNFSWYIQQHTDIYGDNNKQLTHIFYDSLNMGFRPNSDHFDMLQPIIKKFGVNNNKHYDPKGYHNRSSTHLRGSIN